MCERKPRSLKLTSNCRAERKCLQVAYIAPRRCAVHFADCETCAESR